MSDKIIIVLLIALSFSLVAEELRLKSSATVEVVENGKVVGTRKLKAGTVIEVTESAPAEKGGKLAPSEIAPALFKADRPAAGAVFRARLKLGTKDYAIDEKDRKAYYFVDVDVCTDDWSLSELFAGHVKRTSAVGKSLFALLKDGKEHKCLVKVVPYGTLDDTVEIRAFDKAE